jgi:hypothetical protein
VLWICLRSGTAAERWSACNLVLLAFQEVISRPARFIRHLISVLTNCCQTTCRQKRRIIRHLPRFLPQMAINSPHNCPPTLLQIVWRKQLASSDQKNDSRIIHHEPVKAGEKCRSSKAASPPRQRVTPRWLIRVNNFPRGSTTWKCNPRAGNRAIGFRRRPKVGRQLLQTRSTRHPACETAPDAHA